MLQFSLRIQQFYTTMAFVSGSTLITNITHRRGTGLKNYKFSCITPEILVHFLSTLYHFFHSSVRSGILASSLIWLSHLLEKLSLCNHDLCIDLQPKQFSLFFLIKVIMTFFKSNFFLIEDLSIFIQIGNALSVKIHE